MTAVTKLNILKAIHTFIWLFFNVVIFYLYYAVITDSINKWVWVGIGLILLEGLVLLLFKRLCPVTVIARRYSDSTKDNFDIFLPNWLAKNNKLIYTTLFVIVLLLLAYRLVIRYSSVLICLVFPLFNYFFPCCITATTGTRIY